MAMKYYNVIVYAIGIAFSIAIALYPKPAPAQSVHERHAQGHDEYLNWSSERTEYCCNSDDCHFLNDDEVRETPVGKEVLVHARTHEPTWCPVKPEHYIIKGKSPDWNKSHACVNTKSTYSDPCAALLCFAGKGEW
jgi:hypothetical protein